jgi:hypothetical protein
MATVGTSESAQSAKRYIRPARTAFPDHRSAGARLRSSSRKFWSTTMVWSCVGASRVVTGSVTASRLPSRATSKPPRPGTLAVHARGLYARQGVEDHGHRRSPIARASRPPSTSRAPRRTKSHRHRPPLLSGLSVSSWCISSATTPMSRTDWMRTRRRDLPRRLQQL